MALSEIRVCLRVLARMHACVRVRACVCVCVCVCVAGSVRLRVHSEGPRSDATPWSPSHPYPEGWVGSLGES